ncbi:MAG: sigma-70 family RNA polymerase sigma factor [Planctomycetota bacterium]
MDTAEPVRIEELLAHASWLRRLAASLVRDNAAADDLVQDTWMAALEHPPHGDAPVRPWLARIARNLALNRRRGDARRADRESFANLQRDTSAPSPSRIAEEIEAQRTLADLVLALDEPLRTTVVLRYFRGLDASEISRLQGVPAGTVRWRLKQALDRLRGELDVRFGRRNSWCVAFGALLARDGTTAISMGTTGAAAKCSMALGGTIVSSGTKLGIAVVLVAIGISVWSFWPDATHTNAELIAAASGSEIAVEESALDETSANLPTTQTRQTTAIAEPASATSREQPALGALVAMDCCIVGRVRDPEGRPIAGVNVKPGFDAVEDGIVLDTRRSLVTRAEITTSSDGLFRAHVPAATPLQLSCSHPDYAPLTSASLFAGDTVELVLDKGATLAVSVRVKSDGKPLSGALVRASIRSAESDDADPRDVSKPWSAELRTAADGSATWTVVPKGPIQIVVTADGFASDDTDLDVHGSERVEASFELTQAGVLSGIVRDAASGEPIAGATVQGRYLQSTKTDASGNFQLEIFPLDAMTREVVAKAAGHASAHAQVHFDESHRSEHLEIVLQPELRIRGRLVDNTGHGVPRASLACRGTVSTQPFVSTFVDTHATSDADGRFELGGLTKAVYRLIARAADFGPTVTIVDATVATESVLDIGNLVVTSPSAIDGTVEDMSGNTSELVVRLHLANNGRDDTSALSHLSTTRPDAMGRFAFVRLPAGRFELELVRVHDLDRGVEERTLASTTVELGAGETRRDLVLRNGSATIEGLVVSPDGSREFVVQLSGGSFDAAAVRTETDGEGRFRFWVDGVGPFRLSVTDPRLFCAPKTIDGVQSGDRELRVELEHFRSTHVIRGRVVQASGEPVSEAYVSFTDTTTGQRLGRVALPDEQGRFEMKDLRDVAYDLELLDMKSLYLPLKIAGVRPGGADVEMQLVPRR